MFRAKFNRFFGKEENTSPPFSKDEGQCCAVLEETQVLQKENVTLTHEMDELKLKLANSQDFQKLYKDLKAERDKARCCNKRWKTQVQDLQSKLNAQADLEKKCRAAQRDRDFHLLENLTLQHQLEALSSRLQDCKERDKERQAMKAENKALIRDTKALKKVRDLNMKLFRRNNFEENYKHELRKNQRLMRVRIELQQQEQELKEKLRNNAQMDTDFSNLEMKNEMQSNQIETLQFNIMELNKQNEDAGLHLNKSKDLKSETDVSSQKAELKLGYKKSFKANLERTEADEANTALPSTCEQEASQLTATITLKEHDEMVVKENESLQLKVNELTNTLILKEEECRNLQKEVQIMKDWTKLDEGVLQNIQAKLDQTEASGKISPAELLRLPGKGDTGVLERRLSPITVQKVVRGSFHQGNQRFKYSGVQCMAIAAVSLARHKLTSVFSWDSSDLDHTMVLGDQMYTGLRDSHNFIHPSYLLSVPDLPGKFKINGQELWFTPGEVLSGYIDVTEGEFIDVGAIVSLRNGLELIFSQYSTCLMTLCGYTSAIIFEDGRFAVVDSHSRSDLGLVHHNGTSVVLQFDCLDDLHSYISCLADSLFSEQKPFELCSIIVE